MNAIKSAVVGNWLTTLIGLVGAVYVVLEPVLVKGEMPTKNQVITAIFIAVGGAAAKQFNVTGGNKQQ